MDTLQPWLEFQLSRNIKAAHVGQTHVENDDIRPELARCLKRGKAIDGERHGMPLRLEQPHKGMNPVEVIIDDEDAKRACGSVEWNYIRRHGSDIIVPLACQYLRRRCLSLSTSIRALVILTITAPSRSVRKTAVSEYLSRTSACGWPKRL